MPDVTAAQYADCGGVATGLVNTGAVSTGVGPTNRLVPYVINPLTLQTNAYAASQSPGAGAITLRAGTGITAVTVGGATVYQTDVPRNVTITSGGVDTGITFTVTGYDFYGQAMSEAITGASSTIASGKKAFYQVAVVTHTGSVAGTVIVGTGDVFGLPFVCADKTQCIGVQWNNTLAKDAGTLTVADTTATATTTTGDVRGTYAPSTGASDGSKQLVFTQVIKSTQVGSSATRITVLGVTQA